MKNSAWKLSDMPSQAGKTAVVTGANSGIGWHTALELARKGADVILAARSQEKGQDAIDRIRREIPQAQVRAEVLDLADLRSIRAFAAKIDQEPKLDLLINNAGVMSVPERRLTADGFELQFGTNYLGPFALTGLLLPALKRAASPRITTVSSGAANMGKKRIEFDNLQSERSYHPWTTYCQSKLADLMFALELGRRGAGVGLLSDAAHPGYAITNLQTTGPGRPQNLIERWMAMFLSQDAAHGALPTLYAATDIAATSGKYYGPDGLFQLKGEPIVIPVPAPAQDEAVAQRLWAVSQELTGVSFTEL